MIEYQNKVELKFPLPPNVTEENAEELELDEMAKQHCHGVLSQRYGRGVEMTSIVQRERTFVTDDEDAKGNAVIYGFDYVPQSQANSS